MNKLRPVELFTFAEAEYLRNYLVRPMLFETVTDLDIDRPREKLHALIQESNGYLDRLHSTFFRLFAMLEEMDSIRTGLFSPIDEGIKKLRVPSSELREDLALAHTTDTLWNADSRKTTERILEETKEQYQRGEMLFIESNEVQVGWYQAMLKIRAAGLKAGQFHSFLSRITELIARGTAEGFKPRDPLKGIDELFGDGVDKIFEEAGFALGVTPVYHLVSVIWNIVHRTDINAGRMDEPWALVKKQTFVAAFFHWWSEEMGRRDIEEQVKACESEFAPCEEMKTTASGHLSELLGKLGVTWPPTDSELA